MSGQVRLHGYRYSVYNRIVRLVLHQKQVDYETVEVNPFSELPEGYLKLQPFGRVPVLSHGAFTIFETGAITRYVDRAFRGPLLQPTDSKALARMDQAIAMIDNYGYWPMIRQVVSHRVFRPLAGEPSSEAEVAEGIVASKRVLSALENLAVEERVLTGKDITLADCHLAAMMDYFVRVREGRELLSDYPSLSRWWERIFPMPMIQATDPGLADFASG